MKKTIILLAIAFVLSGCSVCKRCYMDGVHDTAAFMEPAFHHVVENNKVLRKELREKNQRLRKFNQLDDNGNLR